MPWTEKQEQVIKERDKTILVSAAAGSGKTATLVERIYQKMIDPEHPVDITSFLVVTFTKAAAAQMKEKLLKKLEEAQEQYPESEHIAKQNMLIQSADITTIDSFCLNIVKEYFSYLNLDPAVGIGDPGMLEMLKYDVMTALFEEKYAQLQEQGDTEFGRLLEVFCDGKRDENLKDVLDKIYRQITSFPAPERFLEEARMGLQIDTAEDYSKFISARLAGYQKKPAYEPANHVILMGLEAATPGRMSINYYEELGGREYLDRLGRWYENCFWRISWFDNDKKRRTGVLTPSLEAIGNAVFGRDEMMSAKRDVRDEKSGTKQVRHFYMNMLACISGGGHAPVGYTMTAYHRVLNPQSFRNRNGSWQITDWIDCMGVTLAMLKSADTKEEYNVALNEKETDRSYLYGRLTAVADIIESRALYETDSDRMTNAARLFTVMQQRPATTWQNLEKKLSPYFGKLSAASRTWYKRMIDSIIELGDDLLGDNSPLSPRFIEGYHNQRYVLLSKKKEN